MSAVVVTGASRGIGRATALALAERRVQLALVGRPSAALDETARLAKLRAPRVELVLCELSDPEEVVAAANNVLEAFGAPLAIINNAAVIRRERVEDTSVEAWDEQLAVNLRAPFVLTRALLPAMRAMRTGRIVNVSSISATIGSAGAAAYCASKWGLVGFMKSLAEELSDSGLMTVAVLPGSVDTRMLEGSGFAPRMLPDEVARTLVHYALDASLAHNGGIVEMFGI